MSQGMRKIIIFFQIVINIVFTELLWILCTCRLPDAPTMNAVPAKSYIKNH